MSRSVTLGTGWARTLTLLAVATLLAGLAAVTTSAVAPQKVLAGKPGSTSPIPGWCNSIASPDSADGVTITFDVGSALYERTSGTGAGFYDSAVGGNYLTNGDLTFYASYAGGDGPWCISWNGKAVDSGILPPSPTDGSYATFSHPFNIDAIRQKVGSSKQGKGRGAAGVLCVGARLTGGTPSKGAPKGHSCFTIGQNSPANDRANLRLRVTTNPAPGASENKAFAVRWNCGGGNTDASVTVGSDLPVASDLPVGTSCTATPVSGPTGGGWKAGSATLPTTLVAGDNLLEVSFSRCDPAVEECSEVLSVITEKPATAPPTDGLASSTSSTVPALGVLLLILAAVLGTIGWFTPATKRIRR